MKFDQADFQIRCEWGLPGLRELAEISDVIVVVDVLSFTTSVDIATARGGVIFPYPLQDESAREYAQSVHAELASKSRNHGFSLSPASLQSVPDRHRLVLPSPNGAALAFAADHPTVLAASLRNARAVAQTASSLGANVAIIPAGEKWRTGDMRPCIEDPIGAGAVIASLPGSRSPEAAVALAAFECFRENLLQALRGSSSGRELIERGAAVDVDLAAELNVSDNVPRLVHRAFVAWNRD